MNKMYYIRHGENVANITKEFSHRLVDYPLTEKGVIQARQTASYFIGKKVDHIYSSPLKRAMETAGFISDATNVKCSIVEELRELNVGDLEKSKPTPEAWKIYTDVTEAWENGMFEKAFPNGENHYILVERFKKALSAIFSGRNNCSIIVVAHGGILASSVRTICQPQDINDIISRESHNCSISEFDIEFKNNQLTCRLIDWANHDHLHGDACRFVSGVPQKHSNNESNNILDKDKK